MSHFPHENPHKHEHSLENRGKPDGRANEEVGRRSFLKLAGFSVAGTALAGCRRPLEKAIPFLVQPEEIVPGRAVWYASTCGGCPAGCGVLVKNRDGRPIKLEGNPAHPLSQGGLCATGQACVLELYDSRRLKEPVASGKTTSWMAVDRAISERLEQARLNRGAVRLLTATMTGPTTRAAVRRFLAGYDDARHVVYDALSCSAILDAHDATHGRRVVPRYRFDRADVIVSIDADFLGTWISPVEYTAGYRARRSWNDPAARRSHHAQIEARLSLTGANADQRWVVSPRDYPGIAASLAATLAEKAGASVLPGAGVTPDVIRLADRLWRARGRSLVVCGVNDLDTQLWVNACNHLLGNYGTTLDLDLPSQQAQGDDRQLASLLAELQSGKVAILIVRGVNPLGDLPAGDQWSQALAKVGTVIYLGETPNETSAAAQFICPEPHFLERWDDHEAVAGVVSIGQPVIQRQGHSRTLAECLHAWMGQVQNDYELVHQAWRDSLHPRQAAETDWQRFWDLAVHDGYAAVGVPAEPAHVFRVDSLPARASETATATDLELELVLYPKVTLRDGGHAHNPLLQELPDPISRIAWDNYVTVSPARAARLGVREGDVVKMVSDAVPAPTPLALPVHIQPGQHDDVAAVALGYGRVASERFAEIGPRWLEAESSAGPNGRVGMNAAGFLSLSEGQLCYSRPVRLEKSGERRELAAIQTYDSLTVPKGMAPHGSEKRSEIVREMTRAAYLEAEGKSLQTRPAPASLWPEHRYEGHRWGMAIDLDACTGCGACVLACQIENNVPAVGRDEMRRSREMHWLRIDRYYAGQGEAISVAFQPMLCQHCENAPCETVCPVLATVHSAEGLNQQVYNRCVGTRYCANNCPYKMRRFNWFDYAHEDALENMILNPDVTVRSRGVMEKCSFCVQRIEAAKIEARQERRAVREGDIQPACQQSCPARAITFGDVNDPNSSVSRQIRSARHYRALEELNVRPAIGYLMVVNDEQEHSGDERHG